MGSRRATGSRRLFLIRTLNYVTNYLVRHGRASPSDIGYPGVLAITFGHRARVQLGCYVWLYTPVSGASRWRLDRRLHADQSQLLPRRLGRSRNS